MTQEHSTPAPAAEITPNLGDARDLRNLLEAVADALTLPYQTPGYDARIIDRAGWALTTIRGALAEDPADIGWNVDYLRARLAAEEKQAAKRGERR